MGILFSSRKKPESPEEPPLHRMEKIHCRKGADCMMVYHPQKTVCPEKICPGETFRLEICFESGPDGCEELRNIVLAMDSSGSMGGLPMQKAAEAAKHLAGKLLGDRQTSMGLIGYSDRASLEVPLTQDRDRLYKGLEGLCPRGNTCHGEAFSLAGKVLKDCRGRKILILFTDGPSNCGESDRAAEKLREQGVEIFCIGLGICGEMMKNWASCPEEEHSAVSCCPCGLTGAFREMGNLLSAADCGKAELLERVHRGFRILNICRVKGGTAEILGDRTVKWTIDPMEAPRTYCLCLEAIYDGCEKGSIEVNESLSYCDSYGNCLLFESPQLLVACPEPGPQEPCPEPVEIRALACSDVAVGERADTSISGLGRIVEVNAVIRDVCPGRAVAAAVLLTEVDSCGKEHNRGLKTFELPALTGDTCRDLPLSCIRFVVPESTAFKDPHSMCKERVFKARVMANYLDTDFTCCETETGI